MEHLISISKCNKMKDMVDLDYILDAQQWIDSENNQYLYK